LCIHVEDGIIGHDSNDNNHEVIKEYHFYISDDHTNDKCFVQYFFYLHYRDLVKRWFTFKEYWVWSDGCSCQFKLAQPFLCLCYLHKEMNIFKKWSFFEMGNRNGDHECIGDCIKSTLRGYQPSHFGSLLVYSTNVLNYRKNNLSYEFNPIMANVNNCL
jgi:hypothetical protein